MDRLRYLRICPYEEYLQTPEWKAKRKARSFMSIVKLFHCDQCGKTSTIDHSGWLIFRGRIAVAEEIKFRNLLEVMGERPMHFCSSQCLILKISNVFNERDK